MEKNQPHKWPFYLKISDHAFMRAHQRIPIFTNTKVILDMVMPRVDKQKFNDAPKGLAKVSTPEYLFIVNKLSPNFLVLVTIIPRSSMTQKNRIKYINIRELGYDLFIQLEYEKLQ